MVPELEPEYSRLNPRVMELPCVREKRFAMFASHGRVAWISLSSGCGYYPDADFSILTPTYHARREVEGRCTWMLLKVTIESRKAMGLWAVAQYTWDTEVWANTEAASAVLQYFGYDDYVANQDEFMRLIINYFGIGIPSNLLFHLGALMSALVNETTAMSSVPIGRSASDLIKGWRSAKHRKFKHYS